MRGPALFLIFQIPTYVICRTHGGATDIFLLALGQQCIILVMLYPWKSKS
jgi:hypothetical protein